MLSIILISLSIEVFMQPFQLTVALQPAFMSLCTAIVSEAAITPCPDVYEGSVVCILCKDSKSSEKAKF